MRHRLALADGTLRSAARALEATSPLATLARGYAIVTIAGSGAVVRDATEAPPGTEVDARLARGRLRARVVSAKP
jgi:exodeoxyribonuclease VII large subunit